MLAYSLHWFWTTNRVRTPNRQKLFLNLAATQISYFHFDLTFSMLCYLSFFFNFFSSRWTRDDIKLLKEKKLVSRKNFHYRCFLTFSLQVFFDFWYYHEPFSKNYDMPVDHFLFLLAVLSYRSNLARSTRSNPNPKQTFSI